MARNNVSYNDIQSLEEDWALDERVGKPYSGESIQRFIRQKFGQHEGKVGAIKITPNQEGTGYVVLGFRTNDDKSDWVSMSENDRWGSAGLALIVVSEALPSLAGDTRSVRIQLQSTPSVNQPTTNVTIGIKGISQIIYGSGQTEDVGEELHLHIQTRTSQSASWTDRGTVSIQSNLNVFTSVSLRDYLVSGTNYVRLRLVSDDESASVWTSISMNVVALSLVSATPVALPISGNSLELRYYIGGSADKTLRLQFGHYENSEFITEYSYETSPACVISIGTAVHASVAKVITLTPSTGVLDNILTPGNHVVRAKLYVSDDVQTDWVYTEYMVAGATPSVVVNDIVRSITNYTDVNFFKWAASQAMNVRFRLTNAGGTEVYAQWEENAVAGEEKILSTQLSIDSEQESVNAYMHIEDTSGNSLHDVIFFSVMNNAQYAPVSNPTFVFQPSTRSNAEENPRRIINAANGQVVPSTGWGTFGMVTDGYVNGAFVVKAGSELAIDFNALAILCNKDSLENGLAERSVTIEINHKSKNVTDETKPIIRLGNYLNTLNDKDIYGLEVLPTEAALLTKNKRVRDDQNVSWAEEEITRLTINVVYGLNPDNDPNGARLNYVRLFVNDTIEREFNYDANDSFIGDENAQLILGSPAADLILYDIRCYNKALSTDDVMRDYRASLPTTQEKDQWLAKNDILGQNGEIDFEKAKNAGYNVIGHTGNLPAYGQENAGETKGQVGLKIHEHGVPATSGDLTNLDSKGQGTTAMTYKDWNQQYKTTDETVFTSEDGTVSEAGTGYAIELGEALAKKLVGKINFASSMQGHKMGLTRAYDELFKYMVSQGWLSEPSQITRQPSARLAVYEKPFLFFHRETENDPWTFRYLMTFGAGKGDKPTFGFDKNATPQMLMLEGADNDRPLALFTAPWNDDVTYDSEKEAWMLGGSKNLNFGFGTTTKANGEEVPSNVAAINAHKRHRNFVYLHSRNVRYYDGTLTQLRARDPLAQGENGYTIPSNNITYWTTQADNVLGAAKYDLFRYDFAHDEWVNASVDGEVLNMRTQYETFASEISRSTREWSGMSLVSITNDFIDMRTAHFAANAEDDMHVDDFLYEKSFKMFFAGTDNNAKNTYDYTDPVTLKIRRMQDDLDTVLKTNNVGQQRKPYYVEWHDKDANGEYYWQGEMNALENLLEHAFADRLTLTMRRMLQAMAAIGGSAMDYLVSRVLHAQDYFPAVAYNEMARLVYERASVAQAEGTYVNNSAQAITQSNGTQRWSEYQWLKDRLMYISSWCEFGEFASGTSASGALTFRGQTGVYAFTLTPAKWLYPRVVHGSSTKEASNQAFRVRVPAGQTFSYKPFQNDGDTSISIRGINYYSEIGDMNIPLSSSMQTNFEFAGKRLRKVVVNATGEDENLFVAQQITVTATNITEFTIRGVDTLRGEIDLRDCEHLETVDLRGSSPSSIRLPQTATMKTVHLPDTLETLNMSGMAGLTTFSMAGASNIRTAIIPGSAPASQDVVSSIYNDQQAQRELSSLTLTDINWSRVSVAMLLWLAETQNSNMTGVIAIDNNPTLSLAEILSLSEKFGDITSQENSLYIIFSRTAVRNIGITGRKYFSQTGEVRFGITTEGNIGNNIAIKDGHLDMEWSFIVDNGSGGEEESLTSGGITLTDAVNGVANISSLNAEGDETRQILQVKVKLTDNTVISRRWKVGLFDRIPHRGDFAFADGTFDDDVHLDKSVVGWVIKVTENVGKYTVDVMSNDELGSWVWGVYPNDSQGIPTAMQTEIRQQSGGITLTDFNTSNGQNDTASGEKTTNMVDRAKAIVNGWLKNLWATIDLDAPSFDAGNTYTVGQTVTYEGSAYMCKTAITEAAAWDSTKWSALEDANLTKMRFAKTMAFSSSLPQSITELENMMDAFVAYETALGASTPARFRQIFYPAAYECKLHEPSVGQGETLNQQYAKGKWNLPACAILTLIYRFFHASRNKTNNATPSMSYANEDNSVADADYPLMANVIKRYSDAGLNTSVIKPGTNSYYWSATENSSTNAWTVHFSNGNVGNYNKVNSYVVRPVTAFTYERSE